MFNPMKIQKNLKKLKELSKIREDIRESLAMRLEDPQYSELKSLWDDLQKVEEDIEACMIGNQEKSSADKFLGKP